MMLLNCGVGENSWVPWTARRSNQSILKEINPEYSLEGLMWSWSSRILATWCKQLTHWKSLWCWERLRTEEEEGMGGWDGWMASPMQWIWTWENFRRWWGTGRPAMLQSMGSQRVGHNWVTQQQWQQVLNYILLYKNEHVNCLRKILIQWQITAFCMLFAVVFTGSRKLAWHRAGTQQIFFFNEKANNAFLT